MARERIGIRIGELAAYHMRKEIERRPNEVPEVIGEMLITLVCAAYSVPAYMIEKSDRLDDPETVKQIMATSHRIAKQIEGRDKIKIPPMPL